MRLRALGYFTGVLGLLAARFPDGLNLCPERPTLEQQLKNADIVVLAEVTYDRDCRPSGGGDAGRPFLGDCSGRRADVRVIRSWKGPLSRGDGLALVMPAPSDSTSLFRQGEVRVVFAKLQPRHGTQWWGYTDECKYPDGVSSDSALVKALDTLQNDASSR